MFWPFIELDGELSYMPLADFGTHNLSEGKDVYGKIIVAQPVTGHIKLHNASQIAGKIVLMERGHCDFVTKVLHAQEAGAIAVVMANSNTDDPHAAFVMDAGRRSPDQVSCIRIPAMMLAYNRAKLLFQEIRASYLDRRDHFCVTIKFLSAQTAAFVLEQQENAVHQQKEQELLAIKEQEREEQQREAIQLLRSRLGRHLSSSDVTESNHRHSRSRQTSSASSVSCSLLSSTEFAYESSSLASSNSHCSEVTATNNQAEIIESTQQSFSSLPTIHHWCPMTSALLILDVQNYFIRQENARSTVTAHGRGAVSTTQYYKHIHNVMLPTIEDVLLACRACEGMEILYSVIESATRDGRDRSRAHKHAGIHVAKGGFGAQILSKISPTDNDIVIPRTGINDSSRHSIFEATNVDYLLRNLGVSHLVVMGISLLRSIYACVQLALERGYHVTVIPEGLTLEIDVNRSEFFEELEQLGCQVLPAATFVKELQSFSNQQVILSE